MDMLLNVLFSNPTKAVGSTELNTMVCLFKGAVAPCAWIITLVYMKTGKVLFARS